MASGVTECPRCRHRSEHDMPLARPADNRWRPCPDCWACGNLLREALS